MTTCFKYGCGITAAAVELQNHSVTFSPLFKILPMKSLPVLASAAMAIWEAWKTRPFVRYYNFKKGHKLLEQ